MRFARWGAFSPWGRWLEVSAVHYQTIRIALPEVLEPNVELDCRHLRTVGLSKGTTPANSFRDIAGVYIIPSYGFGGSEFHIEPDGRFAWSMSTDYTPDFQEYGFLNRDGLEIQLVPVPHPGVKANFPTGSTLRVIEWGDRTYLSAAEDPGLHRFCRAALTPGRRADPRDTMDGYICVSRIFDRAKPPTGLPRLPLKVWVEFVLAELSVRDEDGSLRLVLESLVPRGLLPKNWPAQDVSLTVH